MAPTFLGMNEVQAVVVTGGFASMIAVWAIISQRAIAARKATLDFIRESESDNDLIQARTLFLALATAPDGLGKWAAQEHVNSNEARAIRTVLNEHELVAIAIQRGILDDTTYRRFCRSIMLQRWKHALPFVHARRARSGNKALFHEFEELAKWYDDSEGMPRRRFFWSKFF
jgi:hypothetical protein